MRGGSAIWHTSSTTSFADRLSVERDDPDYLLVSALSSLAEEGIASLLDKRDWLDAEHVATLAGEWRTIAETFADLYRRSNEVLADLDARLLSVARAEVRPEEAGPQIKRALPWGGHPTGMYMALAIETAHGRERLVSGAVDPLQFILTYQEVAESDGDLYGFSGESVAYLRELSQRH